MKISIITVVYNGADHIRDCIDSVLNQTYPSIEYIVVDGQSTDGTQAIVQSYGARIQQFISEPDKGLYDAMNKGIALATGDVVGILNADDFYPNAHIISHIAHHFTNPNIDAVYGDIVYVARDNYQKVHRYWQSGAYRKNAFLWGWMPGHPTFFARRELYNRYGHFRLDLKSAADYELLLRFIHRHHIRLAYHPHITVVMRTGGVSNSSVKNRLRANREDVLAWQLNALKPHLFTLWIKPIRKIGQYFKKPTTSITAPHQW